MARIVKTQVEMEGRTTEHVAVVEGPEPATWQQGTTLEVVGTPAPRVDGFERVTGRARFTYDVHLPGTLVGKILRSPFPHARIASIDTSRAELLPGVRAVLTYINVPALRWKGRGLLLDPVVRFVGDEVAAVAADDEQTAEDAVDLINVQYEELPFVLDPEKALQPDAPRLHPSGNLVGGQPRIYQRGNMDQGWAEAEVTVEETFRTQVAVHNPLEPHGSVVDWVGDSITVWDSTQHVFGVKSELADTLGLPLHQVQVCGQYVGGGFGNKQELGKHTVLAALLSRMTGCPVKIMLSREAESTVGGHRHDTVQRIKIGARRDGTLTAIHLHCVVPVGAYGYASGVDGPARELYACPNVQTELLAVRTNTGPARAFRAPGYTEGTFALESAMDMLAERLDMDPLELRLKNYAEKDPVGGQDYSAKNLRQAYQVAAEKAGWSSRARGAAARAEERASLATRKRGIGMASQIWGGGGGPPAHAVVKLNPDGTAEVLAGSQDIGTGTKTGLAQIAAEALGIPLSSVRMVVGETQATPYGPVSAGSMTISSMGPAVRAAAADVRDQLVQIASHLLKVPRDRLEVKDGHLFDPTSPQRRKSVGEVLSSVGIAMLVGRGSRGPNPPGYVLRTFGAQIAEVEVDVETGRVRVLRVVAVHDFGRVINPMLARSQIEGGVIQGVGYALMEEQVIDERTGRVLNPNLEEYLIPTALDVPTIDGFTIDQADPHSNSLGSKGIGEPPIIPSAPAIANAIYDATGIRLTRLPMSVYHLVGRQITP